MNDGYHASDDPRPTFRAEHVTARRRRDARRVAEQDSFAIADMSLYPAPRVVRDELVDDPSRAPHSAVDWGRDPLLFVLVDRDVGRAYWGSPTAASASSRRLNIRKRTSWPFLMVNTNTAGAP